MREINVSHRPDEWVSDTLTEMGHLLGYARVSKFDQHYDFQHIALKAAEVFSAFTDTASCTLDTERAASVTNGPKLE